LRLAVIVFSHSHVRVLQLGLCRAVLHQFAHWLLELVAVVQQTSVVAAEAAK
jgi:hypothetical protein